MLRAAQYLRMSTDQQKYSLENQAAAIQRYAQRHGFAVVETYVDGGKSGLTIRERDALANLLHDVISGDACFNTVLVYDVSRWGRFQDADEAAHYEFLCRSAGVAIHYCAEPFRNDGSMPSAVMKALKRTMAGEYSRELSVKCYAGQQRLAREGYRVGGLAGYGLRRMMVADDIRRRRVLEEGEYKSLVTDRVVLVPGPDSEVAVVREIYRMFLEERSSSVYIANALNARGITHRGGRPWTPHVVFDILTNEKYIGSNVWGRSTQQLKRPKARLARQTWTVKRGAFKPVIDPRLFERVQQVIANRTSHKTNEQILESLKALLAAKGALSENIIEQCPSVPSLSALHRRLGTLTRIYEMIGYKRPKAELFQRVVKARISNQRLRDELIARLVKMFPGEVEVIRQGRVRRPTLYVRALNMPVSVLLAPPYCTPNRKRCWRVWPIHEERGMTVLLGRINETRSGFKDIFLMPGIDKKAVAFRLNENDAWLKRGTRLATLSAFCAVAGRVSRTRDKMPVSCSPQRSGYYTSPRLGKRG